MTAPAVPVRLVVKNAGAVIANLSRWNDAALAAIRALVAEYGERTQQRVMQLAPVDTGFMRDHVRVDYGPLGYSWAVGWHADEFSGAGFAFYPFFQEFGTRYMAPQPSLFPAYAEMAPQFAADLRALLQSLATNPPRGGA